MYVFGVGKHAWGYTLKLLGEGTYVCFCPSLLIAIFNFAHGNWNRAHPEGAPKMQGPNIPPSEPTVFGVFDKAKRWVFRSSVSLSWFKAPECASPRTLIDRSYQPNAYLSGFSKSSARFFENRINVFLYLSNAHRIPSKIA